MHLTNCTHFGGHCLAVSKVCIYPKIISIIKKINPRSDRAGGWEVPAHFGPNLGNFVISFLHTSMKQFSL